MTDVTEAPHRMMPNRRSPTSPAAWWKASAEGLSAASVAPPATTPSTARNSTARITPVTSNAVIELRLTCATCSGPRTPASTSRCAPA